MVFIFVPFSDFHEVPYLPKGICETVHFKSHLSHFSTFSQIVFGLWCYPLQGSESRIYGSGGNVVTQVPTIINESPCWNDYTGLIGLLSGNYLKYLPILTVNDVNEPTCVVIEQYNERPLIHVS